MPAYLAGFRLPLCKKCLTPQIYVLFLKCQKKIRLFSPRYVIGRRDLALKVTLAVRLDVNALLYQYHRLAVYPYRYSLYPRVGRDRALVLFQSHSCIVFLGLTIKNRLAFRRVGKRKRDGSRLSRLSYYRCIYIILM